MAQAKHASPNVDKARKIRLTAAMNFAACAEGFVACHLCTDAWPLRSRKMSKYTLIQRRVFVDMFKATSSMKQFR